MYNWIQSETIPNKGWRIRYSIHFDPKKTFWKKKTFIIEQCINGPYANSWDPNASYSTRKVLPRYVCKFHGRPLCRATRAVVEISTEEVFSRVSTRAFEEIRTWHGARFKFSSFPLPSSPAPYRGRPHERIMQFRLVFWQFCASCISFFVNTDSGVIMDDSGAKDAF